MAAQLRSISADSASPVEAAPRLLYKLSDAAAQLSIGRTKLYGLIRTDDIPSIILGGQRYIAHADLVAYVERLRAEAQPYAETAS